MRRPLTVALPAIRNRFVRRFYRGDLRIGRSPSEITLLACSRVRKRPRRTAVTYGPARLNAL